MACVKEFVLKILSNTHPAYRRKPSRTQDGRALFKHHISCSDPVCCTQCADTENELGFLQLDIGWAIFEPKYRALRVKFRIMELLRTRTHRERDMASCLIPNLMKRTKRSRCDREMFSWCTVFRKCC